MNPESVQSHLEGMTQGEEMLHHMHMIIIYVMKKVDELVKVIHETDLGNYADPPINQTMQNIIITFHFSEVTLTHAICIHQPLIHSHIIIITENMMNRGGHPQAFPRH